jgi:Bacterial Ig-like domain
MSSGQASNAYMYGGTDGNSVGVTDSGNVGTSVIYNNIKNVGRVILRSSAPYQLPDCPASWVTIYNDSANGDIWLGGITDHVPQVNVGYPILPGAQLTIPVTNSNQISLIPSNDGDPVYIVIGATDNSAPISPGNPTPLDRTAPTILSSFPASGSAAIPITTAISFLASEPLDPNSINNTNITITPFQTGMQIVQDSSNLAQVLITHTSNLFSFTQFTINVANLTDVAGNSLATPFSFNFTTNSSTVADTTPPSLLSSTPASGATGVSTSVSISLVFSEAIASASVNTSSITVTNVTTGGSLSGYTLGQSSDQKTVTIGSLPLSNSTQYRVDILNSPSTSAIKDIAGNLLNNHYAVTFTTVAPAVIVYNVAGNTFSSLNSDNAYTNTQVYLDTGSALIGKIPVKYSFIAWKVGNPTGSFSIVYKRDNSSGTSQNDLRTLYVASASTLGTSETTITIDDSTNTSAFKLHDGINFRYENGTSTNYIKVKFASPDAFDGTKTYGLRILYDGSVHQDTGTDMAGTIWAAP